MQKLSIIVPAYNEAKTIRRVVEQIFEVAFPVEFEIIIVDDSSSDRTYRLAKILDKSDLKGRIRLYRNVRNRGKGYCIRRGLENASGDVVIVQDADFEYDPHEIPKLLKPIAEGKTSVVYGSRFLGRPHPPGMAFANWIANRFLTWMTNVLFGSKLTDMETCYKLMKKEIAQKIQLRSERFDFEPEVTARILKNGFPILELPISYHGRTHHEGKKIKARDFFIALWVLFRERLRP